MQRIVGHRDTKSPAHGPPLRLRERVASSDAGALSLLLRVAAVAALCLASCTIPGSFPLSTNCMRVKRAQHGTPTWDAP
eukprot:COSAG01_NODE_14883_length_1399_cov_1.284615_1_plen_78_part_10